MPVPAHLHKYFLCFALGFKREKRRFELLRKDSFVIWQASLGLLFA